ncbi:MAG: electron transfer flavoprotein subunit alpha/FixB family protein [Bacteroidales bacterium]
MILVIAEQHDGVLNRASWETIAAAQQMPGNLPVKVAVLGGGSVDAVASELATAAIAEVLAVSNAALSVYTADGFVQAVRSLVEKTTPQYVMLPHTYQTRDFAPQLAATLGRPLIADCVGIKTTDGKPAFVRLLFQGKIAADVVPMGEPPCIVTFQIGSFRADQVQKGAAPAPVTRVEVAVDQAAIRQRPEEPFRGAKQAVDLSQAERIVSVGRGIKDKDNIPLAEKLASALNAELAASRPICDAGWMPMERQVGSSGQTVAPKLYLALGISGAIQHLVGMKGSRTIVAINKDAEAPIFEVADYGVVGDIFEIVPALVNELGQ